MSLLVLSQPLLWASQIQPTNSDVFIYGICSINYSFAQKFKSKIFQLKNRLHLCVKMSKKQPINHSNSIIIRSRHTRGIQSQGICESELNANWHRHFGFGSVTTWQLCQSYSKQVYYSQAQKTIFDDLIFKFSFDDTAEKLMINWYEGKWQNLCFHDDPSLYM